MIWIKEINGKSDSILKREYITEDDVFLLSDGSLVGFNELLNTQVYGVSSRTVFCTGVDVDFLKELECVYEDFNVSGVVYSSIIWSTYDNFTIYNIGSKPRTLGLVDLVLENINNIEDDTLVICDVVSGRCFIIKFKKNIIRRLVKYSILKYN